MGKQKPENIELGIRLQAVRERQGLTQERLSELMEITPHYLSSIERGVSGLSLDKLRKACSVLEVSSDYLLFGTEGTEIPSFAALSAEQREIVERILYDCIHLAAVAPEKEKGEKETE